MAFFETWNQNLGRNGWDQPLAIRPEQSAESLNIELRDGGLGIRRQGCRTVTLTGDASSGYRALGRFVPGNVSANAELFIVDGSATTKILRVPPGGVKANLTLKDNIATSPAKWTCAALNNKLFQSYDSTVNRAQVYAPDESTTAIRRAGMAVPTAAPTVANTGAGTYSAVLRYYRFRVLAKVGSTVVRTSNPSPSVSFTPSGAGAAARVTQGALPGEGETHWIVEASADDAIYWQMSGEIAIGTTTWDDTTIPNDYPITGDVPPLDGACYPFPSVKYVLSDGTRLFGLGVWETTTSTGTIPPVAGRLYFTPRIGSSDLGDDERIESTTETDGWIDLALGAGGDDRGLAGPVNNAIFAFQAQGVYMLLPTGNANVPYRRVVLSTRIGAVSHQSIVQAEDENGEPCIYFLDPNDGPYRITGGGTLQWMGKDVFDLWQRTGIQGSSTQVAWGVYDRNRKLVIWGAGTGTYPTIGLVFDVTNGRFIDGEGIRRGWTYWTGDLVQSYCAIIHNSTFDSTITTYQSPFFGQIGGSLLNQAAGYTSDGSTAFQAYVQSRAFKWDPLGRFKKLIDNVCVVKTPSAVLNLGYVTQTLISDWGVNSFTRQVSIMPTVGSPLTRYARPRPDAVDFTDLRTLQVQIGDSGALSTVDTWEIELWEGNIELLRDAR